MATAMDWRGKRGCIRAILFGSLAANQRISSHETRDPASRVTAAVSARRRRPARRFGHENDLATRVAGWRVIDMRAFTAGFRGLPRLCRQSSVVGS